MKIKFAIALLQDNHPVVAWLHAEHFSSGPVFMFIQERHLLMGIEYSTCTVRVLVSVCMFTTCHLPFQSGSPSSPALLMVSLDIRQYSDASPRGKNQLLISGSRARHPMDGRRW